MKKFEELPLEERKEIVSLFSNWLKCYTHDVIIKAIRQRDEIINNKFAMYMLKELKIREEKESKEFDNNIRCLLNDFETFKQFNIHHNILTHSKSYREVLNDMYL